MQAKSLPLIVWALAVVSSAYGGKQLGTISASGPFELRGAAVPASAARSLPLLDGDQVETAASTAVILLNDSSRIAVDQNSELKVDLVDEETVFCFEEGTIQFSSAKDSQLVVCAQARRIKLHDASEGTVSINHAGEVVVNSTDASVFQVEESKKCPCRANKMPIVLVGAAGAAAAVVGTATAGGDDPPLPTLSPTQR